MRGARRPRYQSRIRDDGVELGNIGLPVPGVRGTAVLFAVMILVIAVPGILLVTLGSSRSQAVGVGLLGAAAVLVALGVYAVRERRRQLAGRR